MPIVKSAPTFEDLTIDDRLSEHQRVVRYVKSSIGLQRYFLFLPSKRLLLSSLFRLVHVKMIADVSESIG